MAGGNIEVSNYEFRMRTKAFAQAVIDEINIMRVKAGLVERDVQYWKDRIIEKLAIIDEDLL